MGKHKASNTARYAAQGFTLIEALVALLVLSIGLLGVASMQLKALQSAHAGYQRSIASLAAQDAVELLWSGAGSVGCPPISLLENGQWLTRWQEFLPELKEPIVNGPTEDCVYDILIEWNDQRFEDETAPALIYQARLPKGVDAP